MTATTATVRDMAIENPAPVRVFEKCGIEFRRGGRAPLADACVAKGLRIDEVIASLEAATAPLDSEEKDWGVACRPGRPHQGQPPRLRHIPFPRAIELEASVARRQGYTSEEIRNEPYQVRGPMDASF